MTRTLKVDLGDGDSVLSIEIVGCPCGAEDLQMFLVGQAREWKRNRKPKTTQSAVKPCGCKEK